MKGRTENEKKIELKINKLLKTAPEIVKLYSYSFSNKTPMTKLTYIRHVICFIEFLEEQAIINVYNVNDFDNIKTHDINRYMEHIKHYESAGEVKEAKEGIRAVKLFAISNFFNFLVNEEYIKKNPCKKVEVPKSNVNKDIIAMTPDEIKHLKENIINGVGTDKAKQAQKEWRSRDIAIVTLGCTTGLRVTSIAEINIEDIDFNNNTIIVTEKGNKTRTCHISEKTMDSIKEWLVDREIIMKKRGKYTDALFITNRRTRITTRTIANMLKKYTYDINKHITPHKMRSSCATNLYERTSDIYLVQNILGHKNIANTRRYARISENKQKMAANILDDIYSL